MDKKELYVHIKKWSTVYGRDTKKILYNGDDTLEALEIAYEASKKGVVIRETRLPATNNKQGKVILTTYQNQAILERRVEDIEEDSNI